jgi:hypothetical protein
MFFWLQFTISGSKFTRYTTFVLPAVYTTAAIGAYYVARWIARRSAELWRNDGLRVYVKAALCSGVVILSVLAAASAVPHFRLYTNSLGGGAANAGAYFTQDEFYDSQVRQVMIEIARRARPRASVASETPTVCAYYAQAYRPDLVCVSLSEPTATRKLSEGDFVIAARGRHYFSNDAVLSKLRQSNAPAFNVPLGHVPAADVYILDQASVSGIGALHPKS